MPEKDSMNSGHSPSCRYKDTDCLKYALMQITEKFFALIDADEFAFCDELLELARKGEAITFDYDAQEDVPFKIVYGGILINTNIFDEEQAVKTVNEMVNYSYAYITREKATVCGYCAIRLYPEMKHSDNFIPFAACMNLPFGLNDRSSAITLTPLICSPKKKGKDTSAWEFMINRPFVLACRKEAQINGLTQENFEQMIDAELLREAYWSADLVDDVEEYEKCTGKKPR